MRRLRRSDLLAGCVLLVAAVIVLWRPLLRGEVFLPLDLLAHMPPWRYSYERTVINNPITSDLVLEYYRAACWRRKCCAPDNYHSGTRIL